MANRTTRKNRHNNKGVTLTFKQRVALGSTHAKLIRGEINYNDVPEWMRKVNAPDVVADDEHEAHEHGDNCTHH